LEGAVTDPLVSIVIPTYNYGHYVIEAVESALAQTYSAIEIIVVDDGSTDDTRQRLAHYSDRIRYIHQENKGLSAARNTGIAAAKGEYIAFLDSDDAFHPRKTEIQMFHLTHDSDVCMIGTGMFSDEPRVWADYTSGTATMHDVSLEELIMASRFAPSSVVARRECFESAGTFDTNLRSVEDRDMWIRIAARYRIGMIDQALTWYRVTPGSMSRNPERMEQCEDGVLKRAFATLPQLKGRWLLRRKALSMAAFSAAIMYREAGRTTKALARCFRSLIKWPLSIGCTRFARSRFFTVTLCRLFQDEKRELNGVPH
jgi:glycosyltransferase involved in cell wall biosynthesis